MSVHTIELVPLSALGAVRTFGSSPGKILATTVAGVTGLAIETQLGYSPFLS
jgi:hypothetical protein